jgi:riboflavin kinase/FMN adenylyltransferase
VLVEEELAKFSPEKNAALTIGVFDGVHLGHKHLIARLQEEAGKDALLSGVITFRQHPEDLLTPKVKLPFLTDMKARTGFLKKEGVDIVIPLSFTPELARLDARSFMSLLQKHVRMRCLVIGADFALGKGRKGDTAALQKLGQEMKFSVTVVPPLMINGEVVSSTAIRQAMAAGDMPKVRKLAGHYFSLHGRVVPGTGRGEGLGFPTANLHVSKGQALPPDGVYTSWAHINGKSYESMTNVGKCPTFDSSERTIETYIIDYSGDLYGNDLYVDLVGKLRDEEKFASVAQLKSQIINDIKQGRKILDSVEASQP